MNSGGLTMRKAIVWNDFYQGYTAPGIFQLKETNYLDWITIDTVAPSPFLLLICSFASIVFSKSLIIK